MASEAVEPRPEAQLVRLDVRDAVATITLDRPQTGNSLDVPLAQALLQAVLRCDSDPAIRCVVLTGSGKMFCVGGDLGAFTSRAEALPALLSELIGIVNMAVSRLLRMPKPLIVLVNGPAAGAGFSLALVGDLVLASHAAHFTSAYGSVGLTPDGGMTWLLPRLVGLRKAQELVITDRRVAAEEAEALGLISRVVDAEALADEGAQLAAKLAAAPTRAIGLTRSLLLQSYDGGLESHLERETRGMMAAGASRDSQEGVAAFLARRKPEFTGD